MKVIIQTRSEENGLVDYPTFKEAMEAAKKDYTIWKISFDLGNERVRLVKDVGGWIYVPFD